MDRIVFILSLLMGTLSCNGQSTYADTYSKAEDFVNNHFVFKFNCDSGEVRVSLGKMINIHQKKVSHSFNYAEVYGYRNCDKKVFIILNKSEYEIINTEEIILYKTENVISKSSEPEQHYFFSVTLASPLLPLTIQNLECGLFSKPSAQRLVG